MNHQYEIIFQQLKQNKMRGNRDRSAFQYKNKKFQQIFIQGLGSNHNQNQQLSYCNINNIPPSTKDMNNIPDYNTLFDLQFQLKKEQQRIEERIKSELLQTSNSIASKSSMIPQQKISHSRLGTPLQDYKNLGLGLQIMEMSPQPTVVSHFDNSLSSDFHHKHNQHFDKKKRQQFSGALSSLALSGKPILLEQLTYSFKKRNLNNQIALENTLTKTLESEQRQLSGRVQKPKTPKKESINVVPQTNNELILKDGVSTPTIQAMNIPDDNNSASELSPKLLQTVQMRHGCKVEIKEEVIHENNLSMDIESLDVSASLQQEHLFRDNGNHITIIGLESQDQSTNKKCPQNQKSKTSLNTQENYLQDVTENPIISAQQLHIPTKQQTNSSMMSKQHCNSTSMMLNLQQTAIVGTKISSGSLSQESQKQQQEASIGQINSPPPKKLVLQHQVRSVYPNVNLKFVNLLPPLKKPAIQTIIQMPPSDPIKVNNQISVPPASPPVVPPSQQLKIRQKQTVKSPSKQSQVQSTKGSSSNIILSVVQIQTNNKQNTLQDNNKTVCEDKSLKKNSSQIKFNNPSGNASHHKTPSRQSYSQNILVNFSNGTSITSSTSANNQTILKAHHQQSQLNSPVPPPVPKNNTSIFKGIIKQQEQSNNNISPAPLSKRGTIRDNSLKIILATTNTALSKQQSLESNGQQKKIESLAAQRVNVQSSSIRKQSPHVIKKEPSLLMGNQPIANVMNRSTMILPRAPIANQTQLLSPSKNRFTINDTDNRQPQKQGQLSGGRLHVNQGFANQNQPIMKKTSPLNQTFNKYGGTKSRSIGIGERPVNNQSETNFDLHGQTRANQVERENRYVEQQHQTMGTFFGCSPGDDTVSSSSEESLNSNDPEETTNKLRETLMNEEVVDFSHYMAQQIQKKRERLIKNSFASNLNSKRQGPNNTSYYEHIGYCPADTTDKFRIHGTAPIESTRASSAPDSSESSCQGQQNILFKSILRDQLRIFDNTDLDQIIEQALLKNQPHGVQAKQWAIAEPKKGVVLYGKESNQPNEIASQTKIMTAYVVMKLVEELEIVDLKQFYLRVTKKAERVIGTKAGLIEGQLISIYDCLHALMLPSGNDAAITLATAFGKYLHFLNLTEKRKNLPRDADEDLKKALLKHSNLPLKRLHEASSKMDNKLYIQAFVTEMRRYCKLMKIDDSTNFTNPHGLSDKHNHSSPADVCKIASVAMKNRQLKDIVARRYYECTVVSKEYNINLLQWFNSNKLINDYFIGIKTGTTPSAGPCLCGYFTYGEFSIIVCLMNTKTTESRWKDMAILCLWALDKHMSQQSHFRESIKVNDSSKK